MNANENLIHARSIIEEKLKIRIISFQIDLIACRLKYQLRDGTKLFIHFNDYSEYGYQLIFSDKGLDRVRFDNHDDHWNVQTKPHHFHPRSSKNAIESIFIGDPIKDLPILCELIINNSLRNSNFTFSK